jgi:hypothetical protein
MNEGFFEKKNYHSYSNSIHAMIYILILSNSASIIVTVSTKNHENS